MKPAAKAWLTEERMDSLVQIEPMLLIVAGALSMWLFYWVFLRGVSRERHRSLRHELGNLTLHAGIFSGLAIGYFTLDLQWFQAFDLARLRPLLGLIVLTQGGVTIVKTLKSLITQLLFLGHMREEVPALFINTFTVVAALGVGAWLVARVFDLNIAPLLATSAVASVVLGLAVQDSLGNLFAGIAMQIDKPYEIGDWVEFVGISGRWSGQVEEVTWRATLITGLSDELVVIPNRVIGQGQIHNFSQRGVPIQRTVSFAVPLDQDLERLRIVVGNAVRGCDGVAMAPQALVQFCEIADPKVTMRICYWIRDFGTFKAVEDRVVCAAIAAMKLAAVGVAFSQDAAGDDAG